MNVTKSLAVAMLLLLIAVPLFAAEGTGDDIGGQVAYIVNDYRYEPGDSKGDPDTGHSLCATRCNALSFDDLSVIMPSGWRLLRVAQGRELTVDTGSPFLGGTCVCTADEYRILPNEFNKPR